MASSKREDDSYPPGFRFLPSDLELVVLFLQEERWRDHRIQNDIQYVNFYDYHPKHLKEMYSMKRVRECYFVTYLRKRRSGGVLPSRAAGNKEDPGYWRINGSDVKIKDKDNKTVGYRKSLAFWKGTRPAGEKTEWALHEFRLQENDVAATSMTDAAAKGLDLMKLEGLVVCKLFKRSKRETANGDEDENIGVEEREEKDNQQLQIVARQHEIPSDQGYNHQLELPAMVHYQEAETYFNGFNPWN